jgi:TonB family protein
VPNGRVFIVTAVASHTKAHSSAGTPPPGDASPLLTLIGAPLLVLTHDRKLLETLRQVADPAHEVYAASSEIDLAAALMARHAGVVVLDIAALATPAGQLAGRLHAQFPDVVLIVAGGAEDQAGLAAQITDGSVHRFLHKPVSEQRVRLFVEAGWRRHAETHPGGTGVLAGRGAKWWLLAAGVAALAASLLWVGVRAPPSSAPPAPAAAGRSAASTAGDVTLEGLLARADRALAAGQLVAPQGASAADLYREALRRNARDPRAVNGLEQTIGKLVSDAEGALQQRHLDDAQALADQAHAVSPDHPRVAFLLAQIGAQRERAVLDKAQRAAATGNVAGALAVLDDAARGGHHSLVEEARAQLAQQQVDGRTAEFLRRGREALVRGRLIEPPEQNARFFIESARALAPADAAVQQATQELIARLQAEAGQALTAGHPDQADIWASAALEAGANRADVAALRAEAQRLRGASKADSLAQLALSFNQRLTAGRITDPAADSAKFYLAQLLQADRDHPSTQLARTAFDNRVLEEARGAVRAQDYAGARRWLVEARAAGADPASIGAIDAALGAAQDEAQRASGYVSASAMTRTRYVAPQFPLAARQRAIDGWVDLQFVVNTDGSVGELTIVGAQPVGIFEQAALDAVRNWRYQPVMRAGQAVSQRARVRLRFAMQR